MVGQTFGKYCRAKRLSRFSCSSPEARVSIQPPSLAPRLRPSRPGTPTAGGRASPVRADAPPAARASPRGPRASSPKMTRRGAEGGGGPRQRDRAQVQAAARPQSRAGRRHCNQVSVRSQVRANYHRRGQATGATGQVQSQALIIMIITITNGFLFC